MDRSVPAFTLDSSVRCPKCRHGQPPLRKIVAQYFESGSVSCIKCKKPIDIWKEAFHRAREPHLFFGLSTLGVTMTSFGLVVPAKEMIQIDLTKHGVPEGATVLGVWYNPQGGNSLPVEYAGAFPIGPNRSTKRTVFGIPVKRGDPQTQVQVVVSWIQRGESAEPWLYLLDAIEAAASKRYGQVIVPANAAVEISLMPLISASLERHSSKTDVRNFARNALMYSHALNVVLPFLCGTVGIPQLRPCIRGELNRLRRVRNNFVHEGGEARKISPRVAGELLCAAVFGFEYIRYVWPRLLGTATR